METRKQLTELTESIAVKYAKLLEDRIDHADNGLTGTDLRDIYDGIQMLGHISATLERFSRINSSICG